MCLICMHGNGACYNFVFMLKLMALLLGCDFHAYMSIVCMFFYACQCLYFCYACSVMVLVMIVMYEVIV